MSARNRIIPIFVPHLGCEHNCVFCNQKRISGEERPARAEDVKKATAGFADCQVAFYGGSFTAVPASMQEELLGAAEGHSIRLSTRPDAIDEAVLSRLKRFNVETVELGAQSLDDEVLRLSGRGHTAEDVAKASRQIKEAGFRLILQMMTGLPGDTKEKTLETAKKIIALQPDGVRIYPTVIVKDTELAELWQAGKYREHTVEEAVDWCSAIVPLFEAAGIPVIRLGLNPTDELSGGAALGGAYHPALGELVLSRMMRNELEKRLAGGDYETEDGTVILRVPKEKLSQAIGQHRCNIDWLQEKYHLQRIKILMYNI